MKFMKLGSKPDSFQGDEKDQRFVASELAADIIVHVGEVKFHLHKFPLLSKSYLLQKLLMASNDDKVDEICITDIPGGATAFETCAKFCYGMTVTLNAHNVAATRCAAEYLEMHETVEKGNLAYKIEVFLRTSIFRSWKDSIIVLHTTRSLLPWAEDLELITHCIDSIASNACVDTSKVEWSYTYNRKQLLSEVLNPQQWNGVRKQNQVPKDWWVEDLFELQVHFFKKIILAISARGRMSSQVIGAALEAYTCHRLSSLGRESMRKGGDSMTTSFVETVISLLPLEKGSVSSKFLLRLLKVGNLLSIGETGKKELTKRIGRQLEDASVRDLLIPASAESAMYDIDMILSLVEEFNCSALASGNSRTVVAKLVDGYLLEVAQDPNLPLSKFVDLAELVPNELRPLHDQLYHAIDAYLKGHPALGKRERKRLCGLLNCKKLSVDACAHALQNERLPLRMVVQIMYVEHMRVSISMASCQGGCSRSAMATETQDAPVDSSGDDGRSINNGKTTRGMVLPKKILKKLLSSTGQSGENNGSSDASGSPILANPEKQKLTPPRKARHSVS
ncbi:BTB/POZ domain-containing protein NPY4-like [Zingiber officinale]|uniref:BTB/POZ domain-containing protein NPY4-like n=1 Tax=Zingiber officinale TaxID=94328 RepID=UPI001C4AF33C|nr:BTB/POZ domain-containing protein NPY4-like [Zingiber officinale]XP_042420776.1 BTB/POZ domain-containing protein NPY4-like [Zingiber officinale]